MSCLKLVRQKYKKYDLQNEKNVILQIKFKHKDTLDMKKILGLDLGTNSIGWAVVNAETVTRNDETTYLKPVEISSAGSRIIPMDEGVLGDFDKGLVSVAAAVSTNAISYVENDFCAC